MVAQQSATPQSLQQFTIRSNPQLTTEPAQNRDTLKIKHFQEELSLIIEPDTYM